MASYGRGKSDKEVTTNNPNTSRGSKKQPLTITSPQPPIIPSEGFQMVEQASPPNRFMHVWRNLPDNRYKCVLCGGITAHPTVNDPCEKYEPITDTEKKLCSMSPSAINNSKGVCNGA